MRWLDSITNSMETNLSKVQEMVKSRDPVVLQSIGSKRAGLGVPGRAELRLNQC